MKNTTVPEEVSEIATQFCNQPISAISQISHGSINKTYEVIYGSDERFILQCMSSIFKPSVMENLHTVQPFMQRDGVVIPKGILSSSEHLYVLGAQGRWYRALTYISGRTIHNNITAKGARSAAKLIGAFHDALVDCAEPITTPISHFHNTPFYMERLVRIMDKYKDHEYHQELKPICDEVLKRCAAHKNGYHLPQRIIHADLKVSNILFDDDMNAVALIDMDTMSRGTVTVEMGDALRSWCGTAGEDSSEQVFDIEVCEAALEGYRESVTSITEEEIESIPYGIKLLTLELSARFLADAYEETYFALSDNYNSLHEQNKTRAINQLKFLDAFEASGLI